MTSSDRHLSRCDDFHWSGVKLFLVLQASQTLTFTSSVIIQRHCSPRPSSADHHHPSIALLHLPTSVQPCDSRERTIHPRRQDPNLQQAQVSTCDLPERLPKPLRQLATRITRPKIACTTRIILGYAGSRAVVFSFKLLGVVTPIPPARQLTL